MTGLADLAHRAMLDRALVPTRHELIAFACLLGALVFIAAVCREPVRADGRPSARGLLVCLLLVIVAATGIPWAAGLA